MKPTKVYLGDSVYVDIEHGMIKLTTENGMGPSNTIHLESEVYEQLVNYVERLMKNFVDGGEQIGDRGPYAADPKGGGSDDNSEV